MLRRLSIATLLFLVCIAALWLAARSAIVYFADKKAEKILAQTEGKTDIETSVNTARYMLEHFHRDGYTRFGLIMKLSPYLRNERLPDFLRLPPGSLATLSFEGWCSTATRSMLYILSRRGIEGVQWNMSSMYGAHAAPLIETAEGAMLIDPYYGVITMKGGKPLHPRDAKSTDYMALDQNSDLHFYQQPSHIAMAAQNEPLETDFPLPENHHVFGIIDKNNEDVRKGTASYGMGFHWDYIGHRYDRSWKRMLTASSPVKVQMLLVSEPDDKVLRTLTPRPMVEGKVLTWQLNAGDKIISTDGLAGISWMRMNSYIKIDQIEIIPLSLHKGD